MNELDPGPQLREKLNEYRMMDAPLERAQEELAFSRRMLRARVEEDLHQLVPALGALADTLDVSALELLLAPDRVSFIREAMEKSGLNEEEIRERLLESCSTAPEDLKLLGIGKSL